MAEFEKHLYMIVFPINALVASQLTPEKFAEHYTVGSAKHYKGKVIFVEIDPSFRDPYFEIDRYMAATVPHKDGSPKKTKFVSSYAVLEHIDFRMLKDLYLVTVEGRSLKITQQLYSAENKPGLVRIYQEICPLGNLIGSNLDQRQFGKYIATGTRSKGAPKICFTQFDLNVEEYLHQYRTNQIPHSPIPDVHPTRLFNCLLELKSTPEKKTKTIALNSVLMEASYRIVRHGFWFASETELIFYPMASMEELEKDHYYWWSSIS